MKPRRIALVLLPITVLAAIWLALRAPHADAFGLEAGPMLTVSANAPDGGRAIHSVTMRVGDPRAQALLDALRRRSDKAAEFHPNLTLRAGSREVSIDARTGAVRTDRDEAAVVDPEPLADALRALSPELLSAVPSNPRR